MTYNIFENIQYCQDFVEGSTILIRYAHILPAVIALIIGLFIFLKERETLQAKILLAFSSTFALWSVLNLTIWEKFDRGDLVMFSWAMIESLSVLLFFEAFYFIYVYFEKKDLKTIWKVLFLVLYFPVILLSTTQLNLENFDIQECIATEGYYYNQYVGVIKIFFSILILGLPVFKLFLQKFKSISDGNQYKQNFLLSFGTIVFIYSFLISGKISESTLDFRYEFYGQLSMIVFVGILAYLITKYRTFNIKLIASQALVVTLLVLVASQILVVNSPTGYILSITTFTLSLIFSYLLIRSIKKEVALREQIEGLAVDLQKANDRLKVLDKMKSEFVSIASHQLRSPLTSIRGYSSMLLEGSYGKLPTKAKEAIERIGDSSRYMALSVEDYLNVSRIEAGNMKYEIADFNLKEVAEKVVDEMRPAALKKGLVLMFRSDCNGSCSVHADIGKTRQVILNLIDNAMKYTPKGQITVVAHDDPKKQKMYISIQDTGVGMEQDTIEHLFDKFVRAKNANQVNVTGTGLGLFVAKRMIESMNGRIWCESEGPGKGSIFHFELPLVPGPYRVTL